MNLKLSLKEEENITEEDSLHQTWKREGVFMLVTAAVLSAAGMARAVVLVTSWL